MAILASNSPLQGLSGSIDGVSFKRYKDKTVVSRKPAKRKKDSPLQKISISKFAEASRYARTVLRDPEKREYYRKLAIKLGKHSAYNLIISEFMLDISIEVKPTKPSAAKNKKRIVLTATKGDFKVKEVAIQVISATGEIISTGKANQINTTDWTYTIPAPANENYTMIVTATDALNRTTAKQLKC
jgi:hypothetical protein